mmetsp:Transcript_16910/g.40165  ORF Transcript_16910/g.40165 Transcript_16910/m.40165 type:complete len:212 (+) Transcript_16910:1875-2510(+)
MQAVGPALGVHPVEARPAVGPGLAVVHQLVALGQQVVGRGRMAARRQVAGAGHVHHRQPPNRLGHQHGVVHGPDTQHAVKPLLDEVDTPVRAAQFDLQAWVLRQEARQRRQHEVEREAHRQVHPQAAAELPVLLEQRFDLAGLAEQGTGALGKQFAVGRQADAAGGALEKPGAELGLQRPHDLADTPLGQTQFVGRAAEVGQFGDLQEDAQ